MTTLMPAATLDQLTQQLFKLVDALDIDGISRMTTGDWEGVDEITRGWIRGRAALESYFSQLKGTLDEVSTQVRDIHSREWGDTGIVTCVIDQTYRMKGEAQRITAPTSLIMRRDGGGWKVALVHSVPLPEPTQA